MNYINELSSSPKGLLNGQLVDFTQVPKIRMILKSTTLGGKPLGILPGTAFFWGLSATESRSEKIPTIDWTVDRDLITRGSLAIFP